MKKKFRFSIMIMLVLSLSGCDKEMVELPVKPVEPQPTDSVEIKSDTAYYTVREAQASYKTGNSKEFSVVGYIVGDIAGTSIHAAEFETPFNSVSNILIADDSTETNAERCFPIALTINSIQREQLNLKGNPHLLHSRIVVRGPLDIYFTQVGMRQLNSWKFVASVHEVQPDTATEHKTDTVASIPISQEGEVIHGGRVLYGRKKSY
jgi:hypothetical protein